MSKDLEIIRQLEKQIDINLPLSKEIDLEKGQNGYVIDEQGNVTGLSLCDFKIYEIYILKGLTNLTTLYLSSNQISDISPLEGLKNLTGLNLWQNQIRDISPIKNLTNLTDLNLRSNQISDISTLKGLVNLTTLYLSANKISDISAFKDLTNLTMLDLRSNQISEISSLKDLTNLNVLDLSNNKIIKISALKSMTNLTMLNLKNNQIANISPLKVLTNLTRLNLMNNQIINISPLKYLTNSNDLDLRYNQIKMIPTEIINLKIKIVYDSALFFGDLNLYGNPLESPPVEIVKQGKKAIRNYFKSIEKEASRVFEAKLLIVGEGGVGKTCLMKRIMIPDKDIDQNELTTEGIDINQWMVQTTRTKNFRINFWDFGGQEIYHATHQFFLTKRSLYLFVWDARTDDNLTSFDYWLNVIKLLSDNSPVIVVLNKIDERIRSIDEHSIQTKFQNIVAFEKVSALEKTGIDGLTSKIREHIANLPHVGDVLPTVWISIRKKLELLNKNFISYDEYKAICREFGLDEQKAEFLSRYYHDLGVFLHFLDNALLREILFLKPDWATDAVYNLIDTKEIQKADGKFHFDQLKKIWSDYPQDKYAHLLELMKKFELCFQIDGSQNYIIPELLRPSKPVFKWDYTDNIRFEYRYDFMPAGIITRFIVRIHDIIKKDIYWKNGVVLQRENTEALVVNEQLNRKIGIWVRGENRKELLAIIRREIDYIHETLNKPDVKQMIPCICNKCAGSVNPYFFDYETVCRFRSKGMIACSESTEDVSIEKLLGDYETPEERETRKDKVQDVLRAGDIYNIRDSAVFFGPKKGEFQVKIDKLVYNKNLGISKEQFSEIIGAIKKLPDEKQNVIEKHFVETAKAKTEGEKKSICERIKRFLVDNGIPVTQSFTGSAILELAKMFR